MTYAEGATKSCTEGNISVLKKRLQCNGQAMSNTIAVAALQSLAHLTFTSEPILAKRTRSHFTLRILRRARALRSTTNSAAVLIDLEGTLIPVQRPVIRTSERWLQWDNNVKSTLNRGAVVYKPQTTTNRTFATAIIPFLVAGNFDDYLEQVTSIQDCKLEEDGEVLQKDVENFLGRGAGYQWLKVERLLKFLRWLILEVTQHEVIICDGPLYVNSNYTELEVTVRANFLVFLQRLSRAKLKPRFKYNLARPTVILTVPTSHAFLQELPTGEEYIKRETGNSN